MLICINTYIYEYFDLHLYIYACFDLDVHVTIHIYVDLYEYIYAYLTRGGGLGSSTIFKKFNEPYTPS